MQDTHPPFLGLPSGNQTFEANSSAGAMVNYFASANDSVDGSLPVECTPAPGSTFPFGTTSVTCSASDTHGNTATGGFSITVQDTRPPFLRLPFGTQMFEATSPAGATVNYVASANDSVDGAVPVQCTPAQGSTFAFGTTSVTCSASDTHRNVATGSFTITVKDTRPPAIVSVTPSSRVLWPPNHQMVPITLTVNAPDAGDTAPICSITTVMSSELDNGLGDGDAAPDWELGRESLAVRLRAERSGDGTGRDYTIAVTCTDKWGNRSTSRTTTVSVPHDQRR